MKWNKNNVERRIVLSGEYQGSREKRNLYMRKRARTHENAQVRDGAEWPNKPIALADIPRHLEATIGFFFSLLHFYGKFWKNKSFLVSVSTNRHTSPRYRRLTVYLDSRMFYSYG